MKEDFSPLQLFGFFFFYLKNPEHINIYLMA